MEPAKVDTAQADMNYDAYAANYQEELENEHWGRTVLMRDCQIVEIYDDRGDAYTAGCDKYGLGNFSLQEIGEQPFKLVIFTAAFQ